jgi:hypothetical protein
MYRNIEEIEDWTSRCFLYRCERSDILNEELLSRRWGYVKKDRSLVVSGKSLDYLQKQQMHSKASVREVFAG